MNEDKKVITYTGSLAKKLILDMITKDIELCDLMELTSNADIHVTTYIIKKKEINYEEFE
jgi:hypothetical protein